jgi:hypothetical protein
VYRAAVGLHAAGVWAEDGGGSPQHGKQQLGGGCQLAVIEHVQSAVHPDRDVLDSASTVVTWEAPNRALESLDGSLPVTPTNPKIRVCHREAKRVLLRHLGLTAAEPSDEPSGALLGCVKEDL